jgi:hypothetical protein
MASVPRSNSLASGLMMSINLHRNNPGILSKAKAQVVYPFVTIVALVESVVNSCFTMLSTLPFIDAYFKSSVEQLKSSLFTIIWSLFSFLINPFCRTIVADENSAKEITRMGVGNLFLIPEGALT